MHWVNISRELCWRKQTSLVVWNGSQPEYLLVPVGILKARFVWNIFAFAEVLFATKSQKMPNHTNIWDRQTATIWKIPSNKET